MGAIDLASLIVKFVDEIYEKVKRGKKIDDKDLILLVVSEINTRLGRVEETLRKVEETLNKLETTFKETIVVWRPLDVIKRILGEKNEKPQNNR